MTGEYDCQSDGYKNGDDHIRLLMVDISYKMYHTIASLLLASFRQRMRRCHMMYCPQCGKKHQEYPFDASNWPAGEVYPSQTFVCDTHKRRWLVFDGPDGIPIVVMLRDKPFGMTTDEWIGGLRQRAQRW